MADKYNQDPEPIVITGCAEHERPAFGCAGCFRKSQADLLTARMRVESYKRTCAFYANGKHFISRECGHDTILDKGECARSAFTLELIDE